MIVRGGSSVYGASVGILMLDAQFPRIIGDMGNALTWPFPVHYKVVKNATPDLIVRNNAAGMLDPFIEAGRELIEMGVKGIATSCGFLSIYQQDLKDALGIPVAASSLMQVNLINTLLPASKKVGIITIDAESLSAAHLEAAGVPEDTPIVGTQSTTKFGDTILNNKLELDVDASRQDLITCAKDLKANHENVGAVLLECTNMCPYAADIAAAINLPVYSIYDFICWFQSGLEPRRF